MSTVVCADCSSSVPSAQADLSPNGWRCRTCSLRHQIDVHQGADDQIGEISIHEMEGLASKAMGMAVLSLVVSLVCVVLLATGALSGESRSSGRLRAGALVAVPAGIAFAGYELVAWRRARRAAAVMRRRESPPG